MGAPVRFLFDNDFTTPPPEVVAVPEEDIEEEVPKIDLEIHLQELKHAEAAAYQRGFAEGQQNAQAEVHEQLTLKTQRMSEAADKMIALIDSDLKRIEADAMVLTATIAKKIAGFALTNYSDDQIMGLITECLAPLRNVRHLAIRVNEAFVDRLKEPIESLAAKNGFEGRLLILGEPETQPGDCRIEWADGGILFERSEVVAAVDAAIIDYLGEETVDYESGMEMPVDAETVEDDPDDPGPDEEGFAEEEASVVPETGFPADEDGEDEGVVSGEADGFPIEDEGDDTQASSGTEIPDADPPSEFRSVEADLQNGMPCDDAAADPSAAATHGQIVPETETADTGSSEDADADAVLADGVPSDAMHPDAEPQDTAPLDTEPLNSQAQISETQNSEAQNSEAQNSEAPNSEALNAGSQNVKPPSAGPVIAGPAEDER